MWNLSPRFAIYFLCGLGQITYLFWTSVSWICFCLQERDKREWRVQRREKGREPQNGLKLRTTAWERPVEIPGGCAGGQRPLWELMKLLVFYAINPALCKSPFSSLKPFSKVCYTNEGSVWGGILVKIEEGTDFHIHVCVVLNGNSS